MLASLAQQVQQLTTRNTGGYNRTTLRSTEVHPVVEGSVTRWRRAVEAGSDEAAEATWQRCVARLAQVARGQLGRSPHRVADEEDAALSALRTFFERKWAAENAGHE